VSVATRWAPAVALAAAFALLTTVGPLSNDAISDLYVYRTYATGILDGARPYAELGFEYPPLALGPIVLPGLGAESTSAFAWRFGALMLLAALAVQAAVGALGGRRAAWLCVLLPVLAGALLRTRFDLVPVALLLAGLVLVHRERPTAGLAVLALGTATKLFPLLAAGLVLVLLVTTGRRRDAARGAAVFAAVLGLACLPFAGDGFLDQFRFHLDRPVQIESTPASVTWALGGAHITGHPVLPDRFKSNGLDGGPADAVTMVFTLVLLGVLATVVVLLRRARGAPGALDRAVLASLLAVVALGKILSPQYLVWLLPLAALAWVRGDRAVALLIAGAALLTELYFPADYFDLVAGRDATFDLVSVRNGWLLAALALSLRSLATASTGAGPARSRPPAVATSP